MPTKRPTPDQREIRRLRYTQDTDRLTTCTKCKIAKPGTDFTFDTWRTDGRANQCRTCLYRTYRKRRAQQKVKARQLRREVVAGGCVICEEAAACCLHLHHVDPAKKEQDFAKIVGAGRISLFLKELEKDIVVLCANCHAKVHAGILSLPE